MFPIGVAVWIAIRVPVKVTMIGFYTVPFRVAMRAPVRVSKPEHHDVGPDRTLNPPPSTP